VYSLEYKKQHTIHRIDTIPCVFSEL